SVKSGGWGMKPASGTLLTLLATRQFFAADLYQFSLIGGGQRPAGLDQDPADQRIAHLGDAPPPMRLAAGRLARHQAEKRHQPRAEPNRRKSCSSVSRPTPPSPASFRASRRLVFTRSPGFRGI